MDITDKLLASQTPETTPSSTEVEDNQEEVSQEESSLNTDTTSESDETQSEETTVEPQEQQPEEPTQSSEETSTEASSEEEAVEYSDDEFRGVLSDFFETQVDEDKFNLIEKVLKGELNPEPEFANDTVKELNDFLGQGGSITDFLEIKMTDYEAMKPVDLVRAKMRRDYPQLSDDQINRRLDRKYKLDEDRYDEDDVLDGKDELDIDSAEARKYFQELKSKYPNEVQQSKANQTESLDTSAQVEAFTKSFNGAIKNVKEIQIGDFSFKVQEDGIKNASKELSIDNGYLDEKGNFNMEAYTRDKVFLQEKERIVESAINHGKSLALAELKNKRNNTSLEPEKVTNVTENSKSKMVDLLKSLNSPSGGLKF